jgi:hypothetical protein
VILCQMEDSSHQGELSLLEFMHNLQQQSPTRDMDHSTAKLAIELNEERQRRQVNYSFHLK